MQKKILASLLMVPMAYSAFANIGVDVPVNKDSWTANGLVGDALKFDSEAGSIETTGPVGVGDLTYEQKNMPQGTYSLTFTEQTNVAVFVNGKALPENGQFTLETKGDITISVASDDKAAPFKFSGLTLEIVCDFEGIQEALTKKLMENLYKVSGGVNAAFTAINPDALAAKFENSEALNEEATKLNEEIGVGGLNDEVGGLRGMIREIRKGTDASYADAIAIYEKYELWKGVEGNTVAVAMDALIEKVEEHNAAVETLNTRWTTLKTNEANKLRDEAMLKNYEDELAALKKQIEQAAATPAYGEYGKYITETTADEIKAAEDYLAGLTEEVKNHYPADKMADAVIESIGDAVLDMDDALDAARDEFNKANADVAAYVEWLNATRDFLATYKTANSTVAALTGVEGYETVPDSYKTQILKDLEDLYTTTVANFGIKEGVIEGAAGYLKGDKALISNVTNALEQVANAAKLKVTTQNEFMTKDLDALNTVQETLDAIVAPKGANGKEIQDQKDALQARIDALKELVENTYAELKLQVEDFSATVQGIQSDVKTLAAIAGPLSDLQKKLDDAIETIYKDYPEIADKFTSVENNLQEAIDALTLESTMDEIGVVSDAIDEMLANAEKLQAAWDKAAAAQENFQGYLDQLDVLFGNKLLVEGNDFDIANYKAENADYKALLEKHAAFLEALEAAKKAESQACYNAMTELVASYNEGAIENATLTIAKAFETEGTTGNIDVVTNLLADLNAANTGNYAGADEVTGLINDFTAELAKINTAFGTATSDEYLDTETIDETFNKIDEACQELVNKAAEIQKTIDTYKEYQAIYDEFVVDLSKLQELIDADTQYNEENSTAPATAFWTSEIEKIQTAKDELAKEIDEALDNFSDDAKNIKALQEDLQKKYDEIYGNADSIQSNIANNEAANTQLLNLSNNIRTAINSEIDALTAKMEYAEAQGAADIAKEIQGWLNELNNLLINSTDPEDLASIDIEERKDFSTGLADDNWDALKAKYEAVNAKFKDLQKAYNEKYGQDLEAWNNAYLGEQWKAAMDVLLDAYRNAIQTFDQYLYGLKNPGYKAYIADTLEDHRDIYKYIDEINNLATAVQDYVAAQTAAGKLISAADFQTVATDKNAALTQDIKNEVATMEAEVAAKAKEYYAENLAAAEANIQTAETKLSQSGVSEDVTSEALAEQNNNLDKAIQLYDTFETDHQFGIEMDLVANYLDNAKVQPDFDAAAQTQWAIDLYAADDTIANLTKQIEEATFATEDVLNAQKPKFDAAVAAVEALKAAPYSPAELDTLLGLQDALKDALSAAQDAADAIKASSDNNKANQDLYKELTGIIGDYNDQLAELTQFVNSLSAGEDATLTAPKAAVDALKAYVEDNKNALVGKDAQIDALKTAIDNAIKAAYGETVYAENDLLTEWNGKLRAAYNDAKVNSGIENFDTEYKDVKDFIDSIVIPAGYGDGSDFNANEYLETAVELEFNIATYYNQLQKLWDQDLNDNQNPNPNPYGAAQAAVSAAADHAAEVMQAAYAALTECANLQTVDAEAYAQFEQDYQDILAEYEKIQGAAAAEGVRLIYNWQEYVADYAALESTIAKKAEEVAKAEEAAKTTAEKWAASDARYAELLEVYNGLEEAYKALVAKVEGYAINNTAVEIQLENIEGQLEAAKANLDAAKEAHSLTASSVLNPSDTDIESAMEAAGFAAAKAYANKGVAEATEASTALSEALTKNVVPEIAKALLAEQSELRVELEKVKNDIAAVNSSDLTVTPEENVAKLEDLHDQAAAIRERLEAMAQEATENVFVLGDVNLDPDGLVTASDVQLLIQWVGEGKTYEDLYAMSPVIAAAANVAQEPGSAPEINIADITAEINLVMNFDYDTPTTRTFVQRRAAAQGSINAIALGNGRYAISLNSTQAFVAGQFDIVLPAGCEIVNAELAGMSHQLYQFNNDGYTRMIVASMSNEELAGDQLLIIEVEGQGAPSIEGAVFTDANANAYTLGNTTVSGIEGIDAENGTTQRIYNAAGQVMRSIQRGINIIRHSDGTTTKELHK